MIKELARHRELLQMEYNFERDTFRKETQTMGIGRKVKRGDCWFPITLGQGRYNSLNRFTVEVFRQQDEDISHNFEYGKPVCFFYQNGNGEVTYLATLGTVSYAEDAQVTSECDTTYIKLDENRVPITHVNLTYDELVEKVGELETILETDEFQLYAAGDYTYKVVGGIVTSMAIQIADDNNDKVVYNQILNTLAKSNSLKDTHNTGGNYYQYADFQIQFDDFEGYEKLTFSVLE